MIYRKTWPPLSAAFDELRTQLICISNPRVLISLRTLVQHKIAMSFVFNPLRTLVAKIPGVGYPSHRCVARKYLL